MALHIYNQKPNAFVRFMRKIYHTIGFTKVFNTGYKLFVKRAASRLTLQAVFLIYICLRVTISPYGSFSGEPSLVSYSREHNI